MKNFILLTVAFLAFGFTNAQDKKDMSFGVKGGLNVCTITNVNDVGVSSSSLIGFHIGAFGEFMVSDKFAIQPELLYSAQGVSLDFAGDNGDLKLDYINIPVLAKYYFTNSFSVEFGPQVGFLLTAKEKSGGQTVSVKDSMNTTDFGLDLGVGYNVTENFILGIRYDFGLSHIQKDLVSGVSGSKNSVYQFSVGYKF